MEINKNLTDPSKVTFGRFNPGSGRFRYDGKIYTLTGNHYKNEAELDDGTWLDRNGPVYQEYYKQACEFYDKQREKQRIKREQLLTAKKLAAMNSTMTAFEWRVKLLVEHNLLLTRRLYGCGDFEVFRVYNIDEGAINHKGKQILKDKIRYDDDRAATYSAFGVYTDETIQEVVDKVNATAQKLMQREQKQIMIALKKM